MIEFLGVAVLGLALIAAAAVAGPRIGVAGPLLLVVVGLGASQLPFVPALELEPEWILQGVLPPLLYASAVSLPTMNFRREFGAISGLSVALVGISALVLGLFFSWAVPGLDFVWGVALGAIVSPTDAVATSIVKQTRLSRRALVMLDGESLLNDASALVLLRTAIVAGAAAFSFWGAVGTFAYAVAVAVAAGLVAGRLNLAVRKRVTDPTVNTVVSFTVPFLASIPAELLGASGLVAAVVAGLVTGIRAPRDLPPRHRLSDSQNWASVEMVLEGVIFLTMGLQLSAVLAEVEREHAGVAPATLIAAGALAIVLAVRAAYVTPLLWWLSVKVKRGRALHPHIAAIDQALSDPDHRDRLQRKIHRRGRAAERELERVSGRITRMLADIDYFLREPLGPREGVVVVWAGMRGAITVAAAQTLPADTPHRPVLVFVAFAVATMSLLLQGLTVRPLVDRLFKAPDIEPGDDAERVRVRELLARVEDGIERDRADTKRRHRLRVLSAQRAALLDARDAGTLDAEFLTQALRNVDAAQIALELREPDA